jgi:coenzyme F420-0:L-glutamate ligase/coenzyme F420-1:gamma-L-glutamate ligase
VTAPAVADALAGAAALVLAKAAGTPAAVLSGRGDLVLPACEDGPGAAALVRPEAEDLFGLGSRDAVAAATRRSERDLRGFPTPVDELPTRLAKLVELAGHGYPAVEPGVEHSVVVVRPAGDRTAAGAVAERLAALGWADRLDVDATSTPPGAVLALTITSRT